jgi:hypothetical protein
MSTPIGKSRYVRQVFDGIEWVNVDGTEATEVEDALRMLLEAVETGRDLPSMRSFAHGVLRKSA